MNMFAHRIKKVHIFTLHPRQSLGEFFRLKNGKPITVGIDHKIGYTGNYENTTDHFVVIVGKGCKNGNVFYLFYEVGTRTSDKGTHNDNKLFPQENNTLKGAPFYSPNKNYTVTQIRKNA
jgi:hypothetical protein